MIQVRLTDQKRGQGADDGGAASPVPLTNWTEYADQSLVDERRLSAR